MFSDRPTAGRRASISGALLLAIVTATCSNPSGPGCTTCPGPPTGDILVGAGDIGFCGSPGTEATARLLDDIFADPSTPGTIFTAGDNAYPHGEAKDFADCYNPTWGRHLSRTRPTPGNHEYEQAQARPYYAYFGNLAGPALQGYYAYNVSTWRVIGLNSEVDHTANSLQAQWLRTELATNPRTCTIAIWHRPLFSSGPNLPNPDMQELYRILYDANAEIVINGHDHLYERFGPQDPAGKLDAARGIRQFTVGTGGIGMYTPLAAKPNSERLQPAWGIIKFVLGAGTYAWEFIPVPGNGLADSGTGICH